MTYEEVLNRLKICVDECDGCLTCKAMEDSIEIAIEALEKQIPKKPYDTVHCPLCKIEVELQPVDTEQVTYCLHCGQAIDWSDDK